MMMIKSWSLSSYNLYDQCPHKYYHVKILKTPEPTSSALDYGIFVHQQMEDYLKGVVHAISPNLRMFSNEIQNLKKHNAIAEEQWVIDCNWDPIREDNAWFSKNAWLRAKTDARVDNLIIDLKTGRSYDKYKDQAELYALCYFLYHPDSDDCTIEFWYTKTGMVEDFNFHSSDLDEMINKWQNRIMPMFDDEEWYPKINDYCKYCHIKQDCPAWQKAT